MKGYKFLYVLLPALIVFTAGLSLSAKAQAADISLDVEANETLANSQSINIFSLFANNGRGPDLYRLYLKNNNSSEYANNLYLEYRIRSDKIGLIVEVTQVSGQPFSLSPGQQVFATNNNIGDGIPGIEEVIQFNGGLTPAGRTFMNNLKGSTSLPPDRYSIEVNIYQGSGMQYKVASDIAEVGSSVIEEAQGLYLLSPGDIMGSETVISNSYPSFQWSGSARNSYRLLVVETRENESPQSLMEGAESTEPTERKGSPASGTLVDSEMLDVVTDQSTFQYPNTGAQELEAGKTYYWRIINVLQTSSGEERQRSEIWSFTLSNTQGSGLYSIGSAEIVNALRSILGNEFSRLEKQNLNFDGIEIDGQIYRGGQALQKLRELSRQAESGDVIIKVENQ